MISKLTALHMTDPTRWVALIRKALLAAKSVPAAAEHLTHHGYPTTRRMLFNLLREHPDILTDEIAAVLPRAKGLSRGAVRQDKVDGWAPSQKTVQRREQRHRKRTEGDEAAPQESAT